MGRFLRVSGNNMQLLPNGNYQIQNTKTGETKEVPPAQLPSYGLSLPNQSPSPQNGSTLINKLSAPVPDVGASQPNPLPATGDNRFLGGYLPSIGAAISGNIAGLPFGEASPVAAGAAGAGGLVGQAIEQGGAAGLNLLNGKNIYKENFTPKEVATEFGKDAAIQEAGGLLGKLLKGMSGIVGKVLVKSSLPETGAEGTQAFINTATGKGVGDISNEVVDQGITGSYKKLVVDATAKQNALSKSIDAGLETMNNVTGPLDNVFQSTSGKNSAQVFLDGIKENAMNTIVNRSELGVEGTKTAQTLLEQEMNAAIDKAGTTGWGAVADLKNLGNNLGSAEGLSDVTATKKAVYTVIKNNVGSELKKSIPDLASLWTDYGTQQRIIDSAARQGAKAINPSVSSILRSTVLNPLITTNLAQLLKSGGNMVSPVLTTGAQGLSGYLSQPTQAPSGTIRR